MIEKYRGYEVRQCRGHYHISTCGMDLIYGPFDTAEETKKAIDEIVKEQETEDKQGRIT